MAYGDQPGAMTANWEWGAGLRLRGSRPAEGTKYLPKFTNVTPDEVWTHYGPQPGATRPG